MKKFILLLSLFLCSLSNCNAQFSQNFDGGTSTALPAGWNSVNGGSSDAWHVDTPQSIGAHSGTKAAVISYSIDTPHDDYLITPQINVVAGVTDRITYWVAAALTGYNERYDVKVSKTGTAAVDFTDYVVQDNYGPQFYTKRTINLSAYVGQSVYVAFHATSAIYSYQFIIDDVVNDGYPACSPTTPFTENFDEFDSVSVDSNSDFPNCWLTQNAPNVNALWYLAKGENAHSGNSLAWLRCYPATSLNNYLITPKITVIAGVNDRLTFWVKTYTANNRKLKVKVSTTTPVVSSFTNILANSITCKDTYNQVTLDLRSYVGQSIYLAFLSEETVYEDFYIDDVVNDAMPQLPAFPQGFENCANMPGNWKTINPSNTPSWYVSTSGTLGHTGTNTSVYNFSSASQNDLLVTPPIYIVAGVNDRISYWSRINTGAVLPAVVAYAATATNPTLADFIQIKSSYVYSPWGRQYLDLSAYVGQFVSIGLKATTTLTSCTFYFDDFVNDRLIPALHSDCNGVYNLNTQIPVLLNGQNPSDYTITFYTSEASANQGTSPITNPESLTLSSGSLIYARLFNTTTNTFTVDYFSLKSHKVNFQFEVSQSSILANGIPSEDNLTLQWYDNNGMLVNETNANLNLQTYSGSQYFYLVATNPLTGCNATSTQIHLPIMNPDTFTITIASTSVTITSSVFANDILPSVFTASNQNEIPGITLNNNGTFSIAAGTAAGTYTQLYNYNGQISNTVHYTGTNYATLIIPQTGIQMNCFIDANSNGIKDTGEQNFTKGNFHYEVNNSGEINNVTSPIGSCIIYDSNLSNSYDLNYTINSEYAAYYSLANTSVSNVQINGSGIQVFNFPITIIQDYIDLAVTLSPMSQPRPGFTYINKIMFTNNGDQTIPFGTLQFNANVGLTITNVSQSGSTPSPVGFSYVFTNLSPFETRYIDVTMQVPTIPIVSLGQLLTNTVSISNPSGETVSNNNSSSLTQTIIGSFDPNEKTENHGGKILQSGFTSNDYLTYTILFENTGTATAENVTVSDVLDAELDENTIRMIDASHGYVLERVGHNLTWKFSDIDLPPSVVDTNIGHGYVVFQIKPKAGYAIGDVIPNTANIYFDFNPAIVTNICTSEFVQSLNINDFAFNNFKCYPNPVKNTLIISNATTIDAIEITSALGQKVMTKKVNALQTEIDLTTLSSGIYFIKAIGSGQVKKIKILKE
jgi:uncharacterized repeat protein (TIGR01451 family)